MVLTTAYEVPRAEPVAVADQTSSNNAVEDNDCYCGVPPTASKPVKATRKISAMIIGIHIFDLFFGRVFGGQWLASLIAITTGCAVLCEFNRCAYTTAAVLYLIGMIFDILSVLFWIMYAEILAEDIADDDIKDDQAERTIRLFSLTPAVGALCLLLGAIAASTAVYSWHNSGALDVETIIESRWAISSSKAAKRKIKACIGRNPGAFKLLGGWCNGGKPFRFNIPR